MDDEKYYYTWEQFDKDIETLANEIKFVPQLIIGITRGGFSTTLNSSRDFLVTPALSLTFEQDERKTWKSIIINRKYFIKIDT